MKTELKLRCTSGQVQYAENELDFLTVYNGSTGTHHEFRDGEHGRELWHKGQNRMIGTAEIIAARS